MRKTRVIMSFILEKQMFIITELVENLARVYFDSQVFIIDLQFLFVATTHTRHGLRGQNECHLSMSVLGNISTTFLGLSVDGNISTFNYHTIKYI